MTDQPAIEDIQPHDDQSGLLVQEQREEIARLLTRQEQQSRENARLCAEQDQQTQVIARLRAELARVRAELAQLRSQAEALALWRPPVGDDE